MADEKDNLAARRWLRQRLAWLRRQYPELQDPEHQHRLSDHLQHEEYSPCPENRQEDPEDAP